MASAAAFPRAPEFVPFLGHIPSLYRDAHRFLDRARQRLGPLFRVQSGPDFEMLVVDGDPGFELYRTRGASSGVGPPKWIGTRERGASTRCASTTAGTNPARHRPEVGDVTTRVHA